MPDQDQEPNAELRHERMARGMGAICRALGDIPAGPKKKRVKAPAKKAKNRSEGYNLQNRRPSGNYQKHRQVLPLDLVQAGEAEWFIEACGKTVSHGGARGTIAGSTTARMHLETIRQQPVLVCSPFIFQVSSPVFFEPYSSLLLCNPVYH